MISKKTVSLIRSLEQKKGRQREGLFVAEGPKVVGDILLSGAYVPRLLAATEEWMSLAKQLTSRDAYGQCQWLTVTDDELRRASLLQHPQQVVGVFAIPPSAGKPDVGAQELALALDGVQDPGNMGTIVRIADWFGINSIICSSDTVDIYNPKVVQATMGSIARVAVSYVDLQAFIASLPTGAPVYGTVLDGNDIYQEKLTPNGLVVLGNEGNGISLGVRQMVNRRLTIPRFSHDGLASNLQSAAAEPHADSLNVAMAAAIVCSEFRRRP